MSIRRFIFLIKKPYYYETENTSFSHFSNLWIKPFKRDVSYEE